MNMILDAKTILADAERRIADMNHPGESLSLAQQDAIGNTLEEAQQAHASALVTLFRSLLDQPNGVTEAAYGAMVDYSRNLDEQTQERLREEVFNLVDATDGQFYLPASDDTDD